VTIQDEVFCFVDFPPHFGHGDDGRVPVSAREWKVGDKGYLVAGTTIDIIQAITSVTNPVQ
jgi:hypothetical protein